MPKPASTGTGTEETVWADNLKKRVKKRTGGSDKGAGDEFESGVSTRAPSGEGAPDPNDPKYQGIAGRAQYNRDRQEFEKKKAPPKKTSMFGGDSGRPASSYAKMREAMSRLS